LSSVQSNTVKTYFPLRIKKNIGFRILVFVLLALWCVGFLFPLIFAFLHNKLIEFFFTSLYSTVCHQQGEKCISFGAMQLLVCARCAGIYFGALLSALLIFSLKEIPIDENVLLVALLIFVADVLLVNLGIYQYSQTISFIAGLLFGASVYIYLMRELENFFFTLNKNTFQ
jgi:uncharacterized membrane protein